MPPFPLWSHSVIREALTLAQEQGQSEVLCSSAREARLFRFAIYNFRKIHNIGHNISVVIDNKLVKLQRRDEHSVMILHSTDYQEEG